MLTGKEKVIPTYEVKKMTNPNDKPLILKVEKITNPNDVKKVKCKDCGKEYELGQNENHSDFQCACGGEMESTKYTLWGKSTTLLEKSTKYTLWEKLFILLLVFIILLLLFFVFRILLAGGL